MLRMLSSVLFTLRVGNVVTASDGGQATDTLKLMGDNLIKAGMVSFDAVMLNWMMLRVDGLTLFKWLREEKTSPDRFMPFVMVSDAADVDKITAARAAGVTECLAKPYSITGLISGMVAVIDNLRQFVLVPQYFGPDRRRERLPHSGPERRFFGDDDAEVVYDENAA
jgi:DNA-binding response OmpR family regulator